MKKALTLLLILTSFLSCRSQSKIDSILSKNADSLNINDINFLIKNDYIRKENPTVIGTYLISIAQKNNTESWTVRQLLDTVKARMKHMDDVTAIANNYGKDSVFIRDPEGNKSFIGMGKLSFEKIVAMESQNLPKRYTGDYDMKLNSVAAIKTLSVMIANSEYPVVTGNVLLCERDSGELKNRKIGDIFEISKRVVSSKEFEPFLDEMK